VILALLFPAALAASPLSSGAYRLDTVIVTESKVPFAGWIMVTNRRTSLVHLTGGDGAWTQRQRLCGVAVQDDLKRAKTVIPKTFVDAQPEQVFPVTLQDAADGWTYAADPGPLDVGWDRATAGDKLPERPDDPGVTDPDGDGHPGATVHLEVPLFHRIDIYVVQRGHTVYEGKVADGGVAGRLVVRRLDQHTLGASNVFFAATPPLRVVPGQSTFSLTPVPPQATCDDLWTPPPT